MGTSVWDAYARFRDACSVSTRRATLSAVAACGYT